MSAEVTIALEREALQAWREGARGEEAAGDERMICGAEALRDWLAWIFEDSPHPLRALRRLLAATSALAPWLMQGMGPRESRVARWLVGHGAAVPAKAAGVCLAGAETSLAAAQRRAAVPPTRTATGLAAMLEREAAIEAEDQLARARAVEAWLARLWVAGPRVSKALKALYVDARVLAPELLLNMSGEEIAAMFGQGRAAESARVKLQVNDFLARAGNRHTQQRFQKSEAACAVYAEVAARTRNRAKKPAAVA